MEASITSTTFDHLPVETQLEIFSFLSAKDAATHRLVCQTWNGLLTDPSIWKRFYVRLYPNSEPKDRTTFQSEVIKKIQRVKPNDNPHCLFYCMQAVKASIKLNQVGITFDAASEFEKFKKMAEQDKTNSPCYTGGYLINMIKYCRYDLQKVMELIPLLPTDNVDICRRLSRVIWNAISENRIKEVMILLGECKHLPIWGPCIRDLAQLLDEQGKKDVCAQLMQNFPDAFTVKNKKDEAYYYIFTKRVDRAEKIALELKESNDMSALNVFRLLDKIYVKTIRILDF